MLLERGYEVVSVEPSDAMREIGIERTKGQNTKWACATGIDSTLKSDGFDWVTFGSSFNVMDRNEALEEAHRLFKKGGYFSCTWNHRDLNDPMQKIVEDTIMEFVLSYTGGMRGKDQRPIIESRKDLFNNIIYLEEDFYFYQSIENYTNAWKSVKNPYWDLEQAEGVEPFEEITSKIRERLLQEFSIKYITCCWSAKEI